jgi:hypothetical protein
MEHDILKTPSPSAPAKKIMNQLASRVDTEQVIDQLEYRLRVMMKEDDDQL